MNIGPYLKQLRLEQGYTLNDVAGKLDISSSFLSQIENMKISPSLDSLEKLLGFYAVNLSDFFRQVEQKRFIIVKHGETETFDLSGGALELTLLASKLQNNSLETYLIKFRSSADFETAVLPKEINGERVVYIIRGEVTAAIDTEVPVRLVAGDSINYKSYIPCRISVDGCDDAEILISGTPPLITRSDAARHR